MFLTPMAIALVVAAQTPSPSTAEPAPAATLTPPVAGWSAPLVLLIGAPTLEGIEAPLDLPVAFAVLANGVRTEVTTCIERDRCRAEARARGATHIALPQIRRLADVIVVTIIAEDLEGRTLAKATDAGAPSVLTDVTRATMTRLLARAISTLRRAADTDGDGVFETDACPAEAGSTRAAGCPDGDDDGVADSKDECPQLAGSSPRGCPDRDADGIVDGDDRCPDVRGTATFAGCTSVAPVADAKPSERDDTPEWGRIFGGSLGTMLGTAVGTATGFGAAWLIKQQLSSGGTVEFSGFGGGVVYGVGAGLGALVGGLAPDIASAGLCSYPLAASGWTRAVHALLVASAAGAGGALVGIGAASEDQQVVIAGLATLGAAPVLGALTVGTGNCISGPPAMPTQKNVE